MSEPWLEYPYKYERIVTDEKLLRVPCYQVDIEKPEQVELARRIVTMAEPLLYIDQAKGNIKDNLIGYGLSAIQMKDLYETSPMAKNAEGALPRVGIIRIPSLLKGHTGLSLDMINPQIIDTAVPHNYKGEGCLSFPGKYHSTRRWKIITVGFIDVQTLKPREIRLYSLEAVVVQHEVDHHDGKLFVDVANIPVTKDEEPKPNDPCPVCLKEGKTKKWKKCAEHNV